MSTNEIDNIANKPDMKHDKPDEIAQPVNVPIPLNRESVCPVDPAPIA